MTDVWLAIIAVAVAVMAAIQVGAIVLGLRLARRVDQLTTQVERDIKPLIQNLTNVTAEAQRAMQLATAQVERADRLFGDLAASAERTMAHGGAVRRWAGPEGPGAFRRRERRCRRSATCARRHDVGHGPPGS